MNDAERLVGLGVPTELAKELSEQIARHGGEHAPVTAAQIADAGPVGREVLQAKDEASARNVIGAGTSNLTIGVTAGTAKAGDYVPTTVEVGSALKAKAQISVLVSPVADYANLKEVTAAIKLIIDALKA